MNTLRFNPLDEWKSNMSNHLFLGLSEMIIWLDDFFKGRSDLKMIEIGSYMGESTCLFASSGMFKEIHCIEPFQGQEEANDLLGNNWGEVKQEFNMNIRFFDNITLHQDFSYNVVDKFKDKSFDFVYIDGSHYYEDVLKDIELYLPKLKALRLIGGHDYSKEFQDVCDVVNELVGEPDKCFVDSSWIKNVGF